MQIKQRWCHSVNDGVSFLKVKPHGSPQLCLRFSARHYSWSIAYLSNSGLFSLFPFSHVCLACMFSYMWAKVRKVHVCACVWRPKGMSSFTLLSPSPRLLRLCLCQTQRWSLCISLKASRLWGSLSLSSEAGVTNGLSHQCDILSVFWRS